MGITTATIVAPLSQQTVSTEQRNQTCVSFSSSWFLDFFPSVTFLDHPNEDLDHLPMAVPPTPPHTSVSLTIPAAAMTHLAPPLQAPTSSRNLCPNLGWPGIMRDLNMSEEITPHPPSPHQQHHSDWQAERKWPVADAHWLCHITALCRVPTGCSIMRYASSCCSATTASPHDLCISVFTAALSMPSSSDCHCVTFCPLMPPPRRHSPYCWF